MQMNEAELNALVEAKLAERLAERERAEREKVRLEVVDQIRREESRKHYDKINSRHPVEDKYGGLGRAGHEERLRQMDERARAASAHMDAVQARPIPGSLAHQRSLLPGSEGFKIK
jgi:hypothetical protein